MRTGNNGVRTTLAAGWTLSLALTAHVWAQAPAPAIAEARNPFAGDPAAVTQGAVLFRQECMFCHGAGARGGMRGPDLTTGSWSHGGSDADLSRTISDGDARPSPDDGRDLANRFVSPISSAAAGRRDRQSRAR